MDKLSALRTGSSLPPPKAKPKAAPTDFSPLPWSDFFDAADDIEIEGDTFRVYSKGTTGPVFFLFHGGGYSGLTWACFAKELSERLECRIVAPDFRGHGSTRTADDGDLSTDRLVKDISNLYAKIFAGAEPEQIFVFGHSMGGALAVHTLSRGLLPNSQALGVIDVVEGSALESLAMMDAFLQSRPTSFASEEEAIRWCYKSGTVRNAESARVSMPSQITRSEDDTKFVWRVDLGKTSPYWQDWFTGLSSKFLSCPQVKVLFLAGTDRLDRELMIGQMQGKFQTTLLKKVGHAIQEDSPSDLADESARFVVRHQFTTLKGDIKNVQSPCC